MRILQRDEDRLQKRSRPRIVKRLFSVGALLITVLICSKGSRVQALQDESSNNQLPVLGVCEVLERPWKAREAIVIGRLGDTDEGLWLAADKCPNHVMLNGHERESVIWVTSRQEALVLTPVASDEVIKRKVEEVKRTTSLRTVRRWRPVGTKPKDGYSEVVHGWVEEREKLVMIAGRIEYIDVQKKPSAKDAAQPGFGHLAGAVAQIVMSRGAVIRVVDDR